MTYSKQDRCLVKTSDIKKETQGNSNSLSVLFESLDKLSVELNDLEKVGEKYFYEQRMLRSQR